MRAGPILDDELGPLLDPLRHYETLILAVSGGADSSALMLLVSRWSARPEARPPRLLVATVDHGLRPGSGAEATAVGEAARRLGLAHEILVWSGPKPATGVQEAAREARYSLLDRLASAHDRTAIVTAHHLDDQAETVLMRLARGSGIDGLGGMRRTTSSATGVHPPRERPLLGIPKARLVATLEAAGLGWIEDPSNRDPAFERVRLREASTTLAVLGLTNAQIARSSERLQRAREAIEAATAAHWNACGRMHGGAYASLRLAPFEAAAPELRLRVLGHALEAFGGRAAPPPLSQLESLLAALEQQEFAGQTLAGCAIERAGPEIRVYREPGRHGLPAMPLTPGSNGIWDNRFRVSLAAEANSAVLIKSLSLADLADVRRSQAKALDLPSRALLTLPSFRTGETLVAAPNLGIALPSAPHSADGAKPLVRSDFLWHERMPERTWT